MGKLNITFIGDIDSVSNQQIQSISQNLVSTCNDTISPSVLGKRQIVNKCRELFQQTQVKTDSKEKNNGSSQSSCSISPMRFCFEKSGKFVCLQEKLLPSLHNIILPDCVAKQFGTQSCSFLDSIKLLIQVCSLPDENKAILLPWHLLGTRQMLSAAKLFGVKLSSTQILQHGKLLPAHLKSLCSNQKQYVEICGDENAFTHLLFAFSLGDIFNCNFIGLFNEQGLTVLLTANNISFKNGLKEGDIFILGGINKSRDNKATTGAKPTDENAHLNLSTEVEVDNLNPPISQENILSQNSNQEEVQELHKTKIVSIESLDTFSAKQLNSLISHYDLEIPIAGKRNLKDITSKFLNSTCYKQQLLCNPLDKNLYCFDGQSGYICLFTELKESKHNIAISSVTRKNYEFNTDPLPFEDSQKILYQTFLAKTSHVLGLPWAALTNTQMIAIAKDRCPGLSLSKIQSSSNLSSYLSACIKQSSEYKNQFKEAKLFDTCLTFGFTIDNPLDFCDWSIANIPEVLNMVARIKDLFRKKRLSMRPKTPKIQEPITPRFSEFDPGEHSTPTCKKNEGACSLDQSAQQDMNTLSTKRIQEEISENIEKETQSEKGENIRKETEILGSNSVYNNMTESERNHNHLQQVTNSITQKQEEDAEKSSRTEVQDTQDKNIANQETKIDNAQKHVGDPFQDADEAHLQTLDSFHSVVSMPFPDSFSITGGDETQEMRDIQSLNPTGNQNFCFKIGNDNRLSIIRNSLCKSINGISTTAAITDSKCMVCKEQVETDDILKCFICNHQVHYACYVQKNTDKPLPNSYQNIAIRSLPNHKWFCNLCNGLSMDKIIENLYTTILSQEGKNTYSFSNTDAGEKYTINLPQKFDQMSTTVPSSSKDMLNTNENINMETERTDTSPSKLTEEMSQKTTEYLQLHEIMSKQIDVLTTHSEALEHVSDKLTTIQTHLSDMDQKQTEAKEQVCDNGEVLKDLYHKAERLEEKINNISPNHGSNISFSQATRSQNYEGQQYFEHKPVQTTLNPECTVIISKVMERKLVENSSTIKKTFNQCYNKMNIKNCFVSKGGSVFIELESSEDATTVVQNWKENYFTSNKLTNGHIISTSCRHLTDSRKSVIMKGIPKDIEESDIVNIMRPIYPEVQVRRFITRSNYRLETVKFEFTTLEQAQKFHREGLAINGVKYSNTEEYLPRQRVIQCYNCFRYGHVAKFCKQLHSTCKNCSGPHHIDQCTVATPNCRNCKSNHTSVDKNCEYYLETVQAIKLKAAQKLKTNNRRVISRDLDYQNDY